MSNGDDGSDGKEIMDDVNEEISDEQKIYEVLFFPSSFPIFLSILSISSALFSSSI